jgi:alpha-glucosidase
MRSNTYFFKILALTAFLATAAGCSKTVTQSGVQSPNKSIELKFTLEKSATGASVPVFSVRLNGKPVIEPSRLGMVLNHHDTLGRNVKITHIGYTNVNEEYELTFGKSRTAVNHYNEMSIHLQEQDDNNLNFQLIFRAYDDGIAFRYHFPENANFSSFEVYDELTSYRIASDPQVFYTCYADITNPHENVYHRKNLSAIRHDADSFLIDLPATFLFPDSSYMAITEADVRNFPGFYLTKDSIDNASFNTTLSPLPGQAEVKARLKTPAATPWRTIMIAAQPGTLIESNLVENLCEPNAIGDLGWIKTGKTTWPWWNGTVAKNVSFRPGVNTKTTLHYIDFASRNSIAFHAISDEDGQAWYGLSRGPDVANQDVTTAIPELDMPKILSYAKEKGVRIRFWVHYAALQKKLDEAFALYEEWGIDGLMVDFFDRNDQEIMLFMEEVLQKAAKHHIKIQFHGAPKPTGLKRTYPNLTNTEGVLNLEWLKWSDLVTPEHNMIVPFTRMLAGPLDYHLGGFRSVTPEDFPKGNPADPRNKNRSARNFYQPHVLGTRAHHLALYVIYENPEPMLCDYPEAYENQPGFDLLCKLPTFWDETRVINAQIGDFITIARRKGEDWFIASGTDWTGRMLSVPLEFLPEGNFAATVYSDHPEADKNPNLLLIKTWKVTNQSVLRAEMVSGGGNIIHLRPLTGNNGPDAWEN